MTLWSMALWIIILSVAVFFAWFVIEKSRRRSHPVTGGLDTSKTIEHQEKFELYANSFSHCSRKTCLTLEELGIDYIYHPIDLIETGWYQTISPAYLRINPAGLLPTLVHDGHPVYESDDILAYAAKAAGTHAPQLVPGDEALRNEMNHWLDFCSISSGDPLGEMATKAGACIPGLTMPLFVTAIPFIPLRKILVGFLFHPDKKRPAFFTAAKLFGLQKMMSQKPVQGMVFASRDHMVEHLKAIDTRLRERKADWIVGDTYCLADISISCLLLRLDETGWFSYFRKAHDLEALELYFHRLKDRPSWQAAIENRAHPIIEQAKRDLATLTGQSDDLYRLVYSGTR